MHEGWAIDTTTTPSCPQCETGKHPYDNFCNICGTALVDVKADDAMVRALKFAFDTYFGKPSDATHVPRNGGLMLHDDMKWETTPYVTYERAGIVQRIDITQDREVPSICKEWFNND